MLAGLTPTNGKYFKIVTKISANYCNGSCQIYLHRKDYSRSRTVSEDPRKMIGVTHFFAFHIFQLLLFFINMLQ